VWLIVCLLCDLICSEANTLAGHAARGWETQAPSLLKKSAKSSSKAHVKFEGYHEGGEHADEMEEFSDYEGDEGDAYEIGDYEDDGRDTALAPLSKEDMQKVESQFESTLDDYDDDLIGALDEVKLVSYRRFS
jgi:hypothetical protein